MSEGKGWHDEVVLRQRLRDELADTLQAMFSGRKVMPNSPDNDVDPRFVTENNMREAAKVLLADYEHRHKLFLDYLSSEIKIVSNEGCPIGIEIKLKV